MKKSKKKFAVRIISYGIYSKWDNSSRDIPKILEFSTIIPAIEGNEFGITLKIKGGKGARIKYIIRHPPFKNKNGELEMDYSGDQIVNSNDFTFFVGDSIQPPVKDKTGTWTITIMYENKTIAIKDFNVFLQD